MFTEFGDLAANVRQDSLVFGVRKSLDDPLADLVHLVNAHRSRGQCGCTNSNAAWIHWFSFVIRNHVLVNRDAAFTQRILSDRSANPFGRHIDQDEVIVGATADQRKATFLQCFRKRFCI